MTILATSLKARMTAYFLLVSMSVVILLAVASYRLSAGTLESMAIARFEVIADFKQHEIARFIDSQVETVEQIAGLETLREAALRLRNLDPGSPAYQSAYLQLANRLFGATYHDYWAVSATDLTDILLLDATSGRVFFSTNPPDEQQLRPTQPFFVEGRLGTHVQPVYSAPESETPTLTISTPLLDMEGEPFAVLAAHIRLPILAEIVSRRTGLGSSGESYLVYSGFRFLAPAYYDDQSRDDIAHSPGIDAAAQGTSGAGLYHNYAGDRVIGSYRWLPTLGLALLTEIDVAEALGPATRLGWMILGMGMLAVLLLGIGIYLITRQIARPILAVSDAAHLIADGDLNQRAPVLTHDETGALADNFNEMVDRLRNTLGALSDEKQKADRLLLNILPAPIADRLKQGEGTIADSFANVSILFADIVNFTPMASRLTPTELVSLLNEIFTEFDRLCEARGLEKIKTIGDAYMAVAGLPTLRDDHAEVIAEMALDMLPAIEAFNRRHRTHLKIRIGINSGPVVAGVIGTKKFIYDIWGDAVNIASRMESQGIVGHIQVSQTTFRYLEHKYAFEDRGLIRIRGKGEMHTYVLLGRREACISDT